jgi:hypothetical protein
MAECSIALRNTPAEYSHEIGSNPTHNDLRLYVAVIAAQSLGPHGVGLAIDELCSSNIAGQRWPPVVPLSISARRV